MQDIVPSDGSIRKTKKTAPRDKVLRLQYRLPARLRRPIGQELRRNRELARKNQAEIEFERRTIRTESHDRRPPLYRRNIGAEHHTGDVYMRSRPEIQVSAPPYISAVAKRERIGEKRMGLSAKLQPIKKLVAEQSGHKVHSNRLLQSKKECVGRENKDKALPAVRDLPYEFKSKGSDAENKQSESSRNLGNTQQSSWRQDSKVVTLATNRPAGSYDLMRKTERQMIAPVNRSSQVVSGFGLGRISKQVKTDDFLKERSSTDDVWSKSGLIQQPNRYLRRGTVEVVQTGRNLLSWVGAVFNRQVAVNAVILVVGCGLVYGVIWNLNGLGRGWQVMGNVQERAVKAYSSLVSASSALAETDFVASEAGFSDATRLIQEAQAELAGAMASSQTVLRWADVTGTVRSGQEILSAGEQLSVAGGYIAQAANQLLGGQGGPSFVAAVTEAKGELVLAEEALGKAEKSLSKVDSLLVPKEIRSQLENITDSTKKIRLALSGFIERSDVVLAMLGAESDKQYLLLFQNNHEIRPTGGFIGSIGLVHIDRGAVEAMDINSVYDPDGQLKEYIEPPQPLKVVSNRWYLRDANWFVNFSASARKVIEFFEKEGGPTVDGVIAMTPEVIRELLKVTGPILMPGYGMEVNYDNFWLVTQDQVSYSYDKQLNEPKKFLADLAPVLLNRLLSGNANNSLEALAGIIKMIEEKQLLVYLNNDNWQTKLTEIGWSGDIPANQPALLAVNNANIAGHKSDQFIEQEIDYRLEIMADGTTEAVVMIKREHRGNVEQPAFVYPEDENPAQKDNIVYQRVLVPKGAKLLEADGFSSAADIRQMVVPETYEHTKADEDVVDWQTGQYAHESGTVVGEEAGYTFFANWLVTKPGKTSVAFYRYRLPDKAEWPGVINPAGRFDTYVVKQSGDMRTTIRVQIDLPENVQMVHAVPESGVTKDNDRTLIYRGLLRKDLLTGMVFARTTD